MKANNENAKRETEERKQKKQIIGKRLSEVMQLKNMDRTAIRKILETDYNYPISRQTFSKYQNGENWIPTDFIELVSKILEIDSDYLLAKDNYFTESYDEYLDYRSLETDKGLPYIDYLHKSGLGFLFSYSGDGEYTISLKDDPLNRKYFTFDELVDFYNSIKAFAIKQFNDFTGGE